MTRIDNFSQKNTQYQFHTRSRPFVSVLRLGVDRHHNLEFDTIVPIPLSRNRNNIHITRSPSVDGRHHHHH